MTVDLPVLLLGAMFVVAFSAMCMAFLADTL